jgi:hypothetical protein
MKFHNRIIRYTLLLGNFLFLYCNESVLFFLILNIQSGRFEFVKKFYTVRLFGGLMGAPGICSEPNGAPGFAQPNGGFTGLTVGARELTHRIVLCKTFIYIYTILWTVRPYSRCWVNDF